MLYHVYALLFTCSIMFMPFYSHALWCFCHFIYMLYHVYALLFTCSIMFMPFYLHAPKDLYVIWFSNLLTVIVPDKGYSRYSSYLGKYCKVNHAKLRFIGGVSGENHRPVDKLYHILLYRVHLVWAGFELTTLVVIGTDCIVSCICNPHTITTRTTTPIKMSVLVDIIIIFMYRSLQSS